MNKRVLFILFVLIGNVAVAILVNYSFGAAHIAEYVALFTSVSTAIYAILAQPKERIEPFLRITPLLTNHLIGDELYYWLDIWIENIGYSIAKDIEVKCRLVPNGSIPLEKNGVIKHSLLAPKEIVKYSVTRHIKDPKLLSQKLLLETHFSNEDDKKQKPIKKEALISELEKGLREVKTS